MASRRLNIYVSEECFTRISLHAIMKHVTMSELVETLANTHLTEWLIKRKCGRSARPKSRSSGYIYFVRDGKSRKIKIGYSKDPNIRLDSLQTGSSRKLSLLATMPGNLASEGQLHKQFASLRLDPNGEWFKDDGSIQAYIDEHATVGA